MLTQRTPILCRLTRISAAFLTGFMLLGPQAQLRSESPAYAWVKSAGGNAFDYGTHVATDPHGNTYVTGYFESQARFEDNTVLKTETQVEFEKKTKDGGSNLPQMGESDIFVAKYNRIGGLDWTFRIGGDSDDIARGLTVDGQGNIYVCGSFISTELKFGAGQVLKRQADSEIFVAKFTPDGKLAWARGAGSGPGGAANDVAVDLEGNVYVTGYFLGQGVFEDLTLDNAGYVDIFVARYAPNGELVWVRQIGGRSDDMATGIEVDEQGSVYICGAFADTMRVSRTIKLEAEGLFDAFVMKLDSEGRTAWAEEEGGYMNDIAFDLALDPAGNLIVTGGFAGSESFASEYRTHAGYREPRRRYTRAYFGRKRLTSNGGADVFVSKYNPAGRLVWVQSAGGTKQGAPEAGYSVAVDARGHSHITGTFAGRVKFGNNILISRGVGDMYVMELDRDGRVLWARQAGTQHGQPAVGMSIAVDRGGNSYVTGYFSGNCNFGSAVIKAARESDIDMFVAKISRASVPPR